MFILETSKNKNKKTTVLEPLVKKSVLSPPTVSICGKRKAVIRLGSWIFSMPQHPLVLVRFHYSVGFLDLRNKATSELSSPGYHPGSEALDSCDLLWRYSSWGRGLHSFSCFI